MTPEEVPGELLEILDARAGKAHNPLGSVVTSLAEILTRYDELRSERFAMTPVALVKAHSGPVFVHGYLVIGNRYQVPLALVHDAWELAELAINGQSQPLRQGTVELEPDDLDKFKGRWLRQCGPCELGVDSAPCTCPAGDYRPTMARLIQEIERLRELGRPHEPVQ
jgi:hypothetical protein